MTNEIDFGSEYYRRTNKMYQDMYEGDGQQNPPIVTRLDRLENAASTVSKLTWVVMAAIVAAIIDAVSHHMH